MLILAMGLALTFYAYKLSLTNARNHQKIRFDGIATSTVESIDSKINQFIFILNTAQALFASSDYIDKEEWHIFTESTQATSLHGIEEIGFIVPLEEGEESAFYEDAKKAGLKKFKIKFQPSTTKTHFIKKYVEPERHLSKIGNDLGNDPEIAEKFLQTPQKNETLFIVITPPNYSITQTIRVMLAKPAYRKNSSSLDSSHLSDRNFLGWVYVTFLMDDTMNDIVDSMSGLVNFDIQTSRAKNKIPAPIIYTSQPYLDVHSPKPLFTQNTTRHKWQITLSSSRYFEETYKSPLPKTIALGGSLITFLISTLVWSLGIARHRAITLAEKMTEELRESEEKFRLLFEMSPNGIAMVDAKGRYALANQAYCKITGYSEQELKGKCLWEISSDENDKSILASKDSIVTYGPFHKEYLHKNGQKVPVLTNGVIATDASGKKLLWSITSDMSELKKLESERLDIEEKLQEAQRLESLGVLAGGIAHDFNNILMAILGNANLASREIPRDSQLSDFIHNIETSSMRAADLCKQMLAYSGKGHFITEKLNLNKLIKDNSALFASAGQKHIEIHYHLAEPLPSIIADASQIRQVIGNLVTNAMESITSPEGEVTIRTGKIHLEESDIKDCLHSDTTSSGDFAFLEIIDTGSGMSDDVVKRIFDPFFTTKFAGRGLGLPAVLGITRGHHGAIRVNSEPGVGTCVIIYFPCVESEGVPPPTNPTESNLQHFSHKILICDDDEMVLNITSKMLSTLGYEVLKATNGDECLTVYREHMGSISLVLLDLTMPRKNGVETLEDLKIIHPGVKVILMSGYNKEEAIHLFEGKRNIEFLQKPFSFENLVDNIASVMAMK